MSKGAPRNADLQRNLARFILHFPQLHDDLFRFVDADVRAKALADVSTLTPNEAVRLWDRAKYISLTRIPCEKEGPPRCRGKVIYDERGANAKANAIWNSGRGAMRVYRCPLCEGFHLSHKW